MKFERGIIKDANNILRNYGAVYIRYNKEKDEFSCADLAEGYIYADGKREYNIPFRYREYPITKKAIISKWSELTEFERGCSNCKNEATCNKSIGFMYGYCRTDYVPVNEKEVQG